MPANEQEDQTMTPTPPQEQTEREEFTVLKRLIVSCGQACTVVGAAHAVGDADAKKRSRHEASVAIDAVTKAIDAIASMQAQAPQSAEPFTRAQIVRLYANSPLAHGDVTSRDAFIRIVHLVEQAHGIGGKR